MCLPVSDFVTYRDSLTDRLNRRRILKGVCEICGCFYYFYFYRDIENYFLSSIVLDIAKKLHNIGDEFANISHMIHVHKIIMLNATIALTFELILK